MNKDQAKGRVKEGIGKIKEVTGKAVGNDRLRVKGAGQKVAGTVPGGYGDVKDAVKKDRK